MPAPVTIPEGYTVAQIAALLDQKSLTNAKEFLALAQDREFILKVFHLDLSNLKAICSRIPITSPGTRRRRR